MPSSLANFLAQNIGGQGEEQEIEKLAEAKVEQELELLKTAEHAQGQGMFVGQGFMTGLMKLALSEASGAETSGMNNENPATSAQTPPKGGVELPTDAPGPNEKLQTTRPGGGEQYNNELLTRKIEEKKLQSGLANVANEGVADLAGAPHGTSAQFAIDHK